jgi:hypothetical protein
MFGSLGIMLLQPMGARERQIRFKIQKDGEPVWDQTTIDRLWATTQREARTESSPLPADKTLASNASEQKGKKEETKKYATSPGSRNCDE